MMEQINTSELTEDLEWLFDFLQRLADGIVAVVGPHCEVVVHDFRNLERSVIAVSGDLTGRQPGAPVADLAFAQEGLSHEFRDAINYRSVSSGRTFQSSTVYFKDSSGEIIGAVCINVDYSSILQANKVLEMLVAPVRAESGLVVEDTFAKDLDDLIELAIAQYLRQKGLAGLEEIGREDKLALVQILRERGLFKIRGAVDHLAALLGVSRATIYNYLGTISREKVEVAL